VANANDHVRAYLDARLDQDATEIAKLYASGRDNLVMKLRGLYDAYLSDEPTFVRARASGAWHRMQTVINHDIDTLTDEVGQRATAKMAELLNTQPEHLERRLAKHIGRFSKLPVTAQHVLGELTTSIIGGATFEDRFMHMSAETKAKLVGHLRQGLINGDDFSTIRAKLMKQFGVEKLKKPQGSAYGSVKVYKNEARRQWNLLMKQQAEGADAMMVWWAMIDDATSPGTGCGSTRISMGTCRPGTSTAGVRWQCSSTGRT
jgi:hypothetical protein